MSRVTVIGGVQVDVVIMPVDELPRPGESLHVEQMSFRVGGAGANAALAFAELGMGARLLGCIGDDHLGHWLAEQLAPLALDGELRVLAGHTTGLTVACEAPARDRTFLTYLGVNAAWEPGMLPDDAAASGSLLVCDYFCAPLLRGAPTRRLLEEAREQGGRTFFDTAWDATGWLAETREEVLGLLPSVDVFLPNEAEARALSGDADGPIDRVASSLQRVSGGWVVVKLGARGCYACGPGGRALESQAATVRVVDSTGAGDAFNAGLIAALADGQDWPAALRAGGELAARILVRERGERRPAPTPARD
jgi:sugar/nucleoside kinase (ribokinase family)